MLKKILFLLSLLQAVFSQNIYMCGVQKENNKNKATLWLTNSQGSIIKTLSIGNLESNSVITDMTSFPLQQQSFSSLSPIKFQRG